MQKKYSPCKNRTGLLFKSHCSYLALIEAFAPVVSTDLLESLEPRLLEEKEADWSFFLEEPEKTAKNIRIQWGSEYQTSLVCKWSKVVR